MAKRVSYPFNKLSFKKLSFLHVSASSKSVIKLKIIIHNANFVTLVNSKCKLELLASLIVDPLFYEIME